MRLESVLGQYVVISSCIRIQASTYVKGVRKFEMAKGTLLGINRKSPGNPNLNSYSPPIKTSITVSVSLRPLLHHCLFVTRVQVGVATPLTSGRFFLHTHAHTHSASNAHRSSPFPRSDTGVRNLPTHPRRPIHPSLSHQVDPHSPFHTVPPPATKTLFFTAIFRLATEVKWNVLVFDHVSIKSVKLAFAG